MAAAIPPLPPLILGLLVFVSRLRRENLGANPKPAGVNRNRDHSSTSGTGSHSDGWKSSRDSRSRPSLHAGWD